MKILDANFLIDYLAGIEATKEFYETNGGGSERWVMPVPAYLDTARESRPSREGRVFRRSVGTED